MVTTVPEGPLSPADEDALFRRLLKRLSEAGQSALDGVEGAAGAVADAAGAATSGLRDTAEAVSHATGNVASQIADKAREVADFVQKHPGVLALGAIGPVAPAALMAITAFTAHRIIKDRKGGPEPVQMLVRVPEDLRDEVKRLAFDEKRRMDELLTEAVLDLLLKYGRAPKALQTLGIQEG